MRDLINITTLYNLTESRGLGARRSGEEFVSTTNPEDKIYVNSVTFYPQDRGMYDSYQEMSTELKQAVNIPGAYVDLLGNLETRIWLLVLLCLTNPTGPSWLLSSRIKMLIQTQLRIIGTIKKVFQDTDTTAKRLQKHKLV